MNWLGFQRPPGGNGRKVSHIGRRTTRLVQNGIITAVARRDFPQINRGKSCSQFENTLTQKAPHVKPDFYDLDGTADSTSPPAGTLLQSQIWFHGTVQPKTEVQEMFSKVPEVTLIFWIIKILATTLGETGGDAVSMSMNLGYLVGTGIFVVIFIIAVGVQISAKKFHPVIYWTTIVATTTVGTTMADFADRSLGIGYAGGTTILIALLASSLFIWYRTMGSVAVDTVSSPKSEAFYWVTIMFSQTLGTALGDWTADTEALGYGGGIIVFGTLLAVIAAVYYWTKVSRTVLFWAAFILTRPLGAVVGDFLDKPHEKGGMALSRYTASATLIVLMAIFIFAFSHKPARRSH
jgi:uncharacterized membrane-anchored protein